MKLPLIIKKQIESSMIELKSEIISADFPPGFREGIYDAALEEIELWQEEKKDIEEIYLDKKNPVRIARHFLWNDRAIIDFNKRKEKVKEFPDSEDNIDS